MAKNSHTLKIRTSYITTIISISLVLFLLGIFCFLTLNAKKVSNYIKENVRFTLILNDNLNEVDIIKYRKELDASVFVRKTEYISKEKAAIDFSEELGENFVDFLNYNPLPASIDVYLKAEYTNNANVIQIEKILKLSPFVKEISYKKSMVDIINNNIQKVGYYILLFSILLGLIALVLINNTIRMLVYSRRFIIRTMSLVGASNGFIRRPFIYASALYGFNAGLLAIILLAQVIYYLQGRIQGIINIYDFNILIPMFIGIVTLGVVISVICTKFALDKYLKMKKDDLYY